ncbi:hypothetical protein ACOJCM_03730 [Billgrantia sp. LNSP4103-1]|uniref:hypothetical protein n=1 Tax=Billgrantia sp. LNSP4103-1 TaxID=3410266 RepID=UPI00403F7469
MTRPTIMKAHYGSAIRLVALLLALLVASNSLMSHAAVDSHMADCGLSSQMQSPNTDTPSDETRCSACSMLPHSGEMAVDESPFPAFAPALALLDHRLPPPRRPPKA